MMLLLKITMPTETKKLSQKEYLKKYLSGGKKKKRKKKEAESCSKSNVVIIDDDLESVAIGADHVLLEIGEDAPQIAGFIDERPPELKLVERYKKSDLWKSITGEGDTGYSELQQEHNEKQSTNEQQHLEQISEDKKLKKGKNRDNIPSEQPAANNLGESSSRQKKSIYHLKDNERHDKRTNSSVLDKSSNNSRRNNVDLSSDRKKEKRKFASSDDENFVKETVKHRKAGDDDSLMRVRRAEHGHRDNSSSRRKKDVELKSRHVKKTVECDTDSSDSDSEGSVLRNHHKSKSKKTKTSKHHKEFQNDHKSKRREKEKSVQKEHKGSRFRAGKYQQSDDELLKRHDKFHDSSKHENQFQTFKEEPQSDDSSESYRAQRAHRDVNKFKSGRKSSNEGGRHDVTKHSYEKHKNRVHNLKEEPRSDDSSPESCRAQNAHLSRRENYSVGKRDTSKHSYEHVRRDGYTVLKNEPRSDSNDSSQNRRNEDDRFIHKKSSNKRSKHDSSDRQNKSNFDNRNRKKYSETDLSERKKHDDSHLSRNTHKRKKCYADNSDNECTSSKIRHIEESSDDYSSIHHKRKVISKRGNKETDKREYMTVKKENYSESEEESMSERSSDSRHKRKEKRVNKTREKHKRRSSSDSECNKVARKQSALKGAKRKTFGLVDAKTLKEETDRLSAHDKHILKSVSADVSGKDKEAIHRDRKNWKKRDFEAEKLEKLEKKKIEDAKKEQYYKWGKGLKQVEDADEKLKSDLHEMSKPLARYADDIDLDNELRKQEHDDDPMLEYIREKKAKQNDKDAKLIYMGAYPPNRFEIRPGHKWDGVDRSNGYEKQWIEANNKKKAVEEEAYKWSTSDM